jgi:hypothetical protein
MKEAIHVLERSASLAKLQAGELRRANADSQEERQMNAARADASESRCVELISAANVLREVASNSVRGAAAPANTEAQRSPASGDKLPPLVRQSGGDNAR